VTRLSTRSREPQRRRRPAGRAEDDRTPLYHRIFLILKSKIDSGEYQEGALLPGEWALAKSFKVSRITAVRALNELARRNLVVRERGRGTRVRFVGRGTVIRGPIDGLCAVNVRWARAQGSVEDFFNRRGARGASRARILDFAYIAADRDVAEQMGTDVGAELQRVTRTWRFEGRPFSYVVTYIPRAIACNWTERDLARVRLADLLHRAGAPIARVEERITASLADSAVAVPLDVAVGSPLVTVVRKAFDAAGELIEYATALYPPDRFYYFVTLSPAAATGVD
jgi:GntR family transcriptional regulator